ncbi:hypothetical protein BDQ12DRAFT_642483 [Crucibulum laeve]|uniref:Translation initiation factor 3 N-terminal domain-containing protein n=1 Tax=Crucibulum laeve TaxID=68775 RepID=A0A5C3MGQ5_9AGAR|nr:hypothetical protein BDQ12DRAFT_642483 [Crucibulum laeve]
MSAFLAFRSAAVSVLKPKTLGRPNLPLPCSRLPQTVVRYNQTSAEEFKKYTKNEKIKYPVVKLVDPETGRLTEPRRLVDIIASIDKSTHFVELVTVDNGPIVKIVSKKEAFLKRHVAKVQAKLVTQRNVQKEMQITWGTEPGDLAHKLAKVRQELEKGHRVDLAFAPKKKRKLPTPEEMKERLEEIVESFADVSKEWKEREFRNNVAAIFLQSTMPVQPPTVQPTRKKLAKLERLEQKNKEAEKHKAVNTPEDVQIPDFKD